MIEVTKTTRRASMCNCCRSTLMRILFMLSHAQVASRASYLAHSLPFVNHVLVSSLTPYTGHDIIINNGLVATHHGLAHLPCLNLCFALRRHAAIHEPAHEQACVNGVGVKVAFDKMSHENSRQTAPLHCVCFFSFTFNRRAHSQHKPAQIKLRCCVVGVLAHAIEQFAIHHAV